MDDHTGPGNAEKEFGFDSQNKGKPGKSLYELLFCGRSLAGKKMYSVEISKSVFCRGGLATQLFTLRPEDEKLCLICMLNK